MAPTPKPNDIDTPMAPPDWPSILGSIMNDKCVLFLGPQASENNKDLTSEFLKELFRKAQKENPKDPDILAYYEHDGILLIREGRRNSCTYAIQKFYNSQTFAQSQFTKLAQLPFKLFILVSPDKSLIKAFEKAGIHKDYCFFGKKDQIKTIPTVDKPLLYGIYGSSEDSSSLIVTYDDLFRHLKSLFDQDLPQIVRTILSEATHYLFLGCEFEKWYFQILVHLLKLSNKNRTELNQSALNIEGLDEDRKLFCEAHLKVDFINHGTAPFIDDLHAKLMADGVTLRKKNTEGSTQSFNLDKIQALLQAAFDDDALNAFCLNYYYEPYNNFSTGMTKSRKVTLLTDYALRHSLIPELLEKVKKENENQFQNHQPYVV